ncbi:MAG TPA: hypothetical protein VNA20_16185 [Frankiaceae bacterium]|nr:hypothetical protein [Frankiaceae bacterium]
MGLTPKQDWVLDRWKGALDVAWAERGDEWIGHLWEALATKAPNFGHNAGVADSNEKIPWRHYIYELRESDLHSQLVLAEESLSKFRVLITGTGEQTPDQVAPWIYAIREARRRTGKSDRPWVWRSYAAIKPSLTSFDVRLARDIALATDIRIVPDSKPILLRPATRAGITAVRLHPATVHALVAQTSAGIESDAQRKAALLVERACQLVSLVLDEPFVVMEDVQLQEGLESLEDAAPLFPDQSTQDRDILTTVGSLDRVIEVDNRELVRAWALLGDDAVLRHAIGAHHQGLRMMDEHHSYAAIAFVSVLETLADEEVATAGQCATCGQLTGLASKYRRAVSEAFGDAAVKILDSMYDHRSKTAHEGILHGPELLPEGYRGPHLSDDRESRFHRRLYLLRATSAQLLRVRLGITCGAPL